MGQKILTQLAEDYSDYSINETKWN